MERSAALSPSRAFAAFAVVCTSGIPVVLLFGRTFGQTALTVVALAIQTAACLVAAYSYRLPESDAVGRLRFGMVVVAGLLTAWPGHFLGPNGSFVAVVALVLVLAGVLSEPGQRSGRVGWVAYGAIAGSQAAVFVAVATRVIDDTSFTPVILGTRSMTSHALGHVFVQGIYLGTYLSGRMFARLYRALAREVEDASRAEAVRAALLEEARGEYRRALLVAQRAVVPSVTPSSTRHSELVPRVDDDPTTPEMPPEVPAFDGPTSIQLERPVPPEPPSTLVTPPPPPQNEPLLDTSGESGNAWAEASRYRMRRVSLLTLVACVGGALVLGAIAVHRMPLYVAWLCIVGIAFGVWVHNRVPALGPGSWWAWTFAAVLSVGPAYSVGLHSGFVGLVVALMFLGGLFNAPDRANRSHHRWRVYLGTALSHALVFLLIQQRVLPDLGNVPVLLDGVPEWQLVGHHLLLQVVYVIAYVAGVRVDRRHAALMAEAQAFARRVAVQETSLADAREAIDRVLGSDAHAIFAGEHVGHYRLERLLGRGGMGDVYEAVDEETSERVAVKLIRRERAADPAALAFFSREAQLLARVRSDHVARVFEAGGFDAGLPFIAMELVAGRSLASILKERLRLRLEEVRVLVCDIAAGLSDVHVAQVLHRDVKPQNVVRTEDGRWKLLDFGVARVHDIVGPARSNIAGTPRYMAPEQALGEAIDARADIYSLSLVIYRALTGRPAFIGDDRIELARAALEGAAPNPRWYVSVPPEVERVLRVGLAAHPGDRFGSAAELASAFDAACDGRLSAELRTRADELLSRAPWSSPTSKPVPPPLEDPSTRLSS